MKRTIGLMLLLAVMTAACGDDDGGGGGALDNCDDVADAAIDLLQETIDIMDDMTAEDLAALSTGEETPDAFVEVEDKGTDLEARAVALGCDDAEMNQMVAERVGDLSSDSQFGQMIIEGVRQGQGGFFSEE